MAAWAALLLGPPAFAWQDTPGADALQSLDPDRPSDRLRAVAALCADQPEEACPLGQRIAAAEWHRLAPHPDAGPALMQTFARSRFGDLPEDPDLFERSLRALQQLDADAQRRAVAEGLAPALVELTWARLLRRWFVPLAEGTDKQALRAVQGWPRAHAQEWAALEDQVQVALTSASEAHGPAFVAALSTDGGSVGEAAAQQVEDDVLAALLRSSSTEAVAATVAVVVGGALGGPATRAALDDVWTRTELPKAVRELARDPALHARLEAALPPLAPPAHPPGHQPGVTATPPDAPPAAWTVEGGDRPFPAALRWLALGAALAAVGGLAGSRGRGGAVRAGGAMLVGLSALSMVEGSLALAGVPTLAEQRPLVAFYVEDKPLLAPARDGTPVVVSPGGPVRHQAVAWPKPDGVLRVAVVGASTAHGSHYLREETFGQLAATALSERLGGVAVEHLNLAIGGALTDGARRAARVALEHGADLLVVCVGHNEASAFSRLGRWGPERARWLPWQLRLSGSSLYGLLASVVPRVAPPPALPAGRPTRADARALHDLATDSARWNLGGILERAQDADAGVVVLIPPTNWRFVHLEPWSSDGPGDAEDLEARMRRAEELAQAGDGVAARRAVQSAIDVSASPREITSGVKAALVETALEHGATLVRADLLFDASAPDGLSASGLFWDDLHPSLAGHALIAEALTPALEAELELRGLTP